ncbi:MAG TPA: hypothetical protein VMB04_18645 [Mycobacterium sp.]|nr:hypothetical protein [Mycobacterium sp.]
MASTSGAILVLVGELRAVPVSAGPAASNDYRKRAASAGLGKASGGIVRNAALLRLELEASDCPA